MSHKRLTRYQFYKQLCDVLAARSSCNRGQAGALVIDANTKKIVSMGYNGAPAGTLHCTCSADDKEHCTTTIHAEANALIHCPLQFGHPLILIAKHRPCHNCLKIAIARNVKVVIYFENYPTPEYDKVSDLERQIPVHIVKGEKGFDDWFNYLVLEIKRANTRTTRHVPQQ